MSLDTARFVQSERSAQRLQRLYRRNRHSRPGELSGGRHRRDLDRTERPQVRRHGRQIRQNLVLRRPRERGLFGSLSAKFLSPIIVLLMLSC